MIKKYFIVLVILFSVWSIPLQLNAQTQKKWWLQSSLADTAKNMLFHVGGKYSFTKMKGVLSGEMHTADITLVVRKRIFTNFSVYGIDKMDLNLKTSTPIIFKSTAPYFTDYIDVDLSKVVFGQLGFIWERDDILLLQNRYSFYTGVGLNILFFKKLKLKSLVAMGRINQEYMIPVDNIDVIKKPYAAFYCKHNYTYSITPNITLAGQFFYFTAVDVKERYRYGINFNLMVALVKHINLMVGYNYIYDRELVLLGLTPDNTMQNLGIEVSF